ncbi:MAG: hypothetical protein ABUK01_05515 [Leptospirales bacterium]
MSIRKTRILITLLSLTLLGLGTGYSAKGNNNKQKDYKTTGSIQMNEKVLTLKSSFNYWDSEKNELYVNLFPFELTKDEMEKLKKQHGGSFLIIMNKPSPDKKFWDWCPYVELTFKFEPNTTELSSDRLVSYSLNIFWIEKKNHTIFFSQPKSQITNEFSKLNGTLKDAAFLELSMKDSNEISGNNFTWKIQVKSIIHK